MLNWEDYKVANYLNNQYFQTNYINIKYFSFSSLSWKAKETKTEKLKAYTNLFLFTVFWRLYCMSVTGLSKMKELNYSQPLLIKTFYTIWVSYDFRASNLL